ncbi:MAG: hypothetical protein IH600_12720 [Bacteroidetes bacterium]|nr:hypothetical protein [Bacteroidota bacterium]
MLLFGIWHIGRYILALTDGHFVYGLDDPYIHLSIARTLVDHGVYGVSAGAVGFASSSVLWPLLLAALGFFTGKLLLFPFILNVLAAVGCLWLIEAMGKRGGLSSAGRFLLMFFLVVLTPLPPLIFMGMEHTLHLFSVLWILYLFIKRYETEQYGRTPWLLLLSIAVSVLLRYETLFLVLPLLVLVLYRRQYGTAFGMAAAAVIPVLIVGAVMLSTGGYFLSNSLLVKGPLLETRDLLNPVHFLYYYLLWPETQAIHWRLISIATLIIGVLFIASGGGRRRVHPQLLYAMLAFIAIHILAVRFDHFNRYTGYIVGSTLTIAGYVFLSGLNFFGSTRPAADARRFTVPLILIAVLTLVPLLMDGMSKVRTVPTLSRNIYEQQYQMGRFLSEYYPQKSVAINDLGLVVYDGHITPVDLAGLADPRIAIARRHRVFTTDSIRVITREHGVDIAVLYRSWFIDAFTLPDEWIPVEEWILQDNVICGSDTLNFYGLNAPAADTLRQRLRRFHPLLPSRVIVREVLLPQ